ncbi:hypothetical protein [Jannaschia sp. W003]|uniref:hypothetical protein n=1 Tax=Jannaschia sp. W003 TaxID=2867012 RepID=UPI0021A95F52|nr:hypothetical protein [Jannaschia sp. W003]UWQ20356.1 hypothetical protein K3554_10140 [Jannaschia sp. W003]
MQQAPKAIYQQILDENSRFLWERDFDSMAAQWVLPAEIGAYDKVIEVETPADLKAFAADFRDNLDTMGATAYYRYGLGADYIDGGCIVGTHTVFAMRGAEVVIEPFGSEMTLLLQPDGLWKVKGIITQANLSDIRSSPGNPRIEQD